MCRGEWASYTASSVGVIMGNGRNLKCGRAGGGRREMRARCEACVGGLLAVRRWALGACTERPWGKRER